MTAVVQISTTVNCVSRPRSKTMKKKRIAQNEDPGMSAMAVGKDTKTSVIPEETTSFIAEFDCLKILVLLAFKIIMNYSVSIYWYDI